MTNSYYEDEVREGFYIPGMIKRSWASQMEILQRITAVCEKYDIKWFADCGTLIGAVRHHGFIPWDDDLDICMLKEDYDRFLEIADKELPSGYKILNIYRERSYRNFLTRIVNHEVIDTNRDYLAENHGFPYISGIDIFPLHYLYNDESEENLRHEKANRIWKLLEGYPLASYGTAQDKKIIREAESISCLKADRTVPVDNALYKLMDSLYSARKNERAEYVALIPFWIKEKNHKFPLSIFEETISVPFENGYMNLPAGYEELLRLEYGNWERVNRNSGLHDYPYYREQEKMLEEHENGRLPYMYYPDKADMVREYPEDKNISIFNTLDELHSFIIKISETDLHQSVQLLAEAQKLAMAVGEAIEKTFGTEGDRPVSLLEKYCELLYEFCDKLSGNGEIDCQRRIGGLNTVLGEIKNEYKSLKSRETVFIISNTDEWKYIKKYYYRFRDKGKKVRLMPVPVYIKNWFAELSEPEFCFDKFRDELNEDERGSLTDYRQYDFAGKQPEICIFNPYDEYREAVTFHPFFYSSELKKYTFCLNFIDISRADIPSPGDEKGRENLKKYILSPAVFRADKVYTEKAEMRSLYLEILSGIDCGAEKSYWEEKIRVFESEAGKGQQKRNGKKLFYTSLSVFYGNTEKAFLKLKKVVKIFAENKEHLYIRWVSDRNFENDMERICPDSVGKYSEIKDYFDEEKLGERITSENAEVCEDCDAYYGSGGYFMNICNRKNIPVMLWDIEV